MASQTAAQATPPAATAAPLPNTTNQPTQTPNPPQPSSSARGMPHYEKIRRDLRVSLQKRQSIEEKLLKLEATLLNYEKAYLEENPAGNIVKGFEGYVKSTSGTGGSVRRKGGFQESDRVFSRSGGVGIGGVGDESVSGGSGTSTPARGSIGGGGAGVSGNNVQTPTSQTHSQSQLQSQVQSGSGLVVKETAPSGGSNHATPGSTSSGNGKSNPATTASGGNKKSSSKRSAGGEDSESESVERKKIKVNFGAGGSAAVTRK